MLKDLKISSRKFIFILSLYFSFILNITFINQIIQNYEISDTLSFFCALFLYETINKRGATNSSFLIDYL